MLLGHVNRQDALLLPQDDLGHRLRSKLGAIDRWS